MAIYRLRSGTLHGVKHQQWNLNNQDAVTAQVFTIPGSARTYHVGLLADGCTDVQAFSRNEVAASLLMPFCLSRIQQLLLLSDGVSIRQVPSLVCAMAADFLQSLARTVVRPAMYWPYPMQFTGSNEFRNHQSPTERLAANYLSATLLGFIDDGETVVMFHVGDGLLLRNDDVKVIDQNGTPDYLVQGGQVRNFTFPSAQTRRIAIASDGLEPLLDSKLVMPDDLFLGRDGRVTGLQTMLYRLRRQHPELVEDDCSVVTLERFEEEVDSGKKDGQQDG